MEKTNINDIEYPLNLILAVTDDEKMIEKADTIFDLYGSVEYILCTLTKREGQVIRYRFSENMTLKDVGIILGVTQERVRQIEERALRKLRHPYRVKYLTKGISGITDEIKENCLQIVGDLKAKLFELYRINKEIANKTTVMFSTRKRDNMPDDINEVGFSVRTLNCLWRENITTMSKLSTLTYDEMIRIRNLGRKSMQEVINKLLEYGYEVDYTVYGRKE